MSKIIQLSKKKIILALMLIVLLNHFNFFKNFYFLVSRDFTTRLNKVYGFCNKESVGFLSYIKKKYDLKQKIYIKNYKISPDPSWIFYNASNAEFDKTKLILLNYKNESQMQFRKITKNKFKTNFLPSNIDGVDKVLFETKKNLKNQTIVLSLIHKVFDNEKIIFKKNININENNEYFINYYNKEINIRNGNLYIQLESLNEISINEMEIKNIVFQNKTKFDLKEYDIVEKIGTCYLLEKNV